MTTPYVAPQQYIGKPMESFARKSKSAAIMILIGKPHKAA
jgi:hypothetical protein